MKTERFLCLLVSCCFVGAATATVPYGSLGTPVAGVPSLGPGISAPTLVPGKEYSHDRDHEITAVGVAPDPQQVVAWDGFGGVANGLDFSGTLPTFIPDLDIDAIANERDFLFDQLLSDDAHLLFSLDDTFTMYGGGVPGPGVIPAGTLPGVTLLNGNTVGGSGEVSYELGAVGGANGPDIQGLWAKQSDINAMPLPRDIDGLEVWGPEPALLADTSKFSIDTDLATGAIGGPPPFSVWNATGTGYVSHAAITAAVTSLLGPITGVIDEGINLDALMVQDLVGSPDSFDGDPTGGDGSPDRIIFSIRQILDPSDADGYYATGSELFVLDGAGGAGFLFHGGHFWDHTYALTTFAFGMPSPDQNYGAFDINAIEAIAQNVTPEIPEPNTLALLALGCLAIKSRRYRP